MAYQVPATNSRWEDKAIDAGFYDSPYQVSLFNAQNDEDSARLLAQTQTIFGLGFAVIGVLAVMPEEVTNWEKSDAEI